MLRLLIAPLIVLGVTLAQRRFGQSVGGLIVGLPLSTLPLLWLVAMQHGGAFATRMSATILAAGAAQVVVIWLYARLTSRMSPTRAIAMALGAFVLVTTPLVFVHYSVVLAVVLTVGAFSLAVQLWPRDAAPSNESGRYRLGLRMVVAASVTMAIASAAGVVGPAMAGLLGALPVMSLMIGFMTHRELGAAASPRFLEGVNRGTMSYVLSILVLTICLRSTNDVAQSFALAILVAAVVQTMTHYITTNLYIAHVRTTSRQRSIRLFERLASTPHLLAAGRGITDGSSRS